MPPEPGPGRSDTARSRAARASYAELSRTPLHVVVFLLPLIVAYEVGLALHGWSLQGGNVRAWAMLADVLAALGLSPSVVVGYSLPGAVIVAVLVLWHALERAPWVVRPRVLGLMAAEAFAWTVPLVLLSGIVGAMAAQQEAAAGFAAMDWRERLLVAIGAGLYEELLFRLALISLLHAVLADLLRLDARLALGLALVGSAAAFAAYHDVPLAASGVYLLAGLYLGGVYLLRGFGIVVGVHALYDALVLVLLAGGGGAAAG